MILVKFTKAIDGQRVEVKDAVYATSRLHVPDHLGRDAEWDVDEDIDESELNETIKAAVAKNGFAMIKATWLTRKPFVG